MRLPSHPLWRRLPILGFVALGLFLYRSPLFPQEREVVWQTGRGRAEIRRVDLQLYAPDGTLLKRDVHEFAAGAPLDLVQKVALRRGRYDARYVIDRAQGLQEAGQRALQIDAEEQVTLSLGRD